MSLWIPPLTAQLPLDQPIVLTQLPASGQSVWGLGGKIILLTSNGAIRVLTGEFQSACDPEVSFDAKHILFAGKKTAADPWTIYEMNADGSGYRPITAGLGDCRNPCYQSAMFTLNSPAPWFQVAFVQELAQPDLFGQSPIRTLYSCKLDGSEVRRLTYTLSNCLNPSMMYDGRLLLSCQRGIGADPKAGRYDLFGVNLDGTDFALYSAAGPARFRSMACSTSNRVIFVESDSLTGDGGGSLGSVTIRRPLYSYQPITKPSDGLFHSPSPLSDGRLLVSHRSNNDSDSYAVVRLNPETGRYEKVFDNPEFHDIQARALVARPEPDGRSSVVSEDDKTGKLYCLNVAIHDLKDPQALGPASAKQLRIIEGTVRQAANPAFGSNSSVERRILGQIDLEKDGSFNIEIPAATPIELQILDDSGMALRTCRWIWAMNHEQRGCIGCHEDPELTPPNEKLAEALTRKSTPLAIEPEQRRMVDFRTHVGPILSAKCATCHDQRHRSLKFTGDSTAEAGRVAYQAMVTAPAGKYITPGQARTSPLVWRIVGRKTTRSWDPPTDSRTINPMPPKNAPPLSKEEIRTLVEWIDLGAMWDGMILEDQPS
ncbi:MAG: hypothetical protein GX455_10885 [Phycisphaerae bacterium]|nr:hypothetical protein [Phycisphaerae bacterium]